MIRGPRSGPQVTRVFKIQDLKGVPKEYFTPILNLRFRVTFQRGKGTPLPDWGCEVTTTFRVSGLGFKEQKLRAMRPSKRP